MPRATQTSGSTIEERLRSAQGVLLLLANLFELQTVAPDFPRRGMSEAASATLASLCRQHGEDLQRLREHLPADVVNDSVASGRSRLRPKVVSGWITSLLFFQTGLPFVGHQSDGVCRDGWPMPGH